MYLALRFRDSSRKKDNRTGPEIHVKVGFLWFEGVDDLHVQFSKPGSDNFRPRTKHGDYRAPHPETGKMTELYSLEIHSGIPCETEPAPAGYMKKLRACWKF